MKRVASALAMLCLLLNAHAQLNRTRLIVRGDDMGYTHSGNEALIQCFRNGLETSIEVIVPSPWFPETVKMLQQNPGVDVGIHLAITSEWENEKWRPLTNCTSIKDSDGYFFPMVYRNENYPGRSISEQAWNLAEVEKEFRAQIEMGLKYLPAVSHLSSHMGCINLSPELRAVALKLAAEYHLTLDRGDPALQQIGYDGPSKTSAEKISSFKNSLAKLEPGKNYFFLDHPGIDNEELKAIWHIGYENVAEDRQGVTDLFTDSSVSNTIREKKIILASYHDITHALPRSTPQAEGMEPGAVPAYLAAVKQSGQELHSLMILRHGKVIAEEWLGDTQPYKNHILNSVSKTFTATAVGFAMTENKLKLSDKVIDYFPNDLPINISSNLRDLEIQDLLTMSGGHAEDPTNDIRSQDSSWEKLFLAKKFVHKPGAKFVYNSLGTYMLSAIVQKVTGQKLVDYLQPRLFTPLGISGVEWEISPSGINTGGWGLYLQTEDLAKMGQFMLQKGNWQGKQLLPTSWFEEATASHIKQAPAWVKPGTRSQDSDWMQGYGYQVWRCRHNAYRADGRDGQFIIVLPEQDAVIVTTANIQDMQSEVNLIWKYLLPAMR